METVQGGVPPYGVKETLVVNGKCKGQHIHTHGFDLFIVIIVSLILYGGHQSCT